MAPYRRVETRDLQGPDRLQVSQVSGDTYAPPERPVQDDNLGRLMHSLVGFSSSIADLAHRDAATQKQQAALLRKQQEEAAKEQMARYRATHTDTQLAQDYREGKVPGADIPVVNGAYQAAIGMDVGQRFRSDIERDFGPEGNATLLNPDGSPIDIDAYVTDRSKSYLDAVPGGTPHGMENFAKASDAVKQRLRELQQGQMAKRAQEQRGVIVSTGLNNALFGTSFPSDPAGIPAYVKSVKGELQGVSKATYAEMDDLVAGTLKQRLASPDATPEQAQRVLQILDAPREDVKTGQGLPAFSQDPKYAQDATQLRASANAVLGKAWDRQQKDGLFKQAQEALVRGDGSFDAVQDIVAKNPYTGETKTFGAKEIKDGAVAFQAQSIRSGVTKQFQGQPQDRINAQVFVAQAEQFVRNGVENPEWKGFLHSSVQAAADTTSLTTPAGQQRMEQAANLYTALRTRSPAYVNSLLDGRDRDFYETYHLLRKMGKTGQEAIEGASRTLDPDSANGDQVKALYQQINTAVARLHDPQSGYMPWNWKANPVNLGAAATEITRRAQLLVRTQGVSGEAAVKAAAASIGDEVPVINGQAQFNRSSFLTIGKEPVVQEALDQVYRQFPHDLKAQGVDSSSGLSVRFENGIYRVINATTGAPLYSVNGDKLTFTDRDLRTTEKIMGTAANTQVRQDRQEAQQSRDAGLKLFEGTPAAPIFNLFTDPQGASKAKNFLGDLFTIPKEGYAKLPSQNKQD